MMKRTTIISIGFTLVTVLTIILLITHLIFKTPNAEKTFLASKEKIELPACTTIQFVYKTDTIKDKQDHYLISDIAVIPDSTGTGNHLSASSNLLDKITTSVDGDVLTIHLDFSNPDLWKKYLSMFKKDAGRKPLITLAIAPEVVNLTNKSTKTNHRVIYRVTGMNRNAFELNLSKNNLILENSTFKQLTIRNPKELNLQTLHAQDMTLIDNKPTSLDRFWHDKCVIDTLEIHSANHLYMSNFTAPKHIRWKALSNEAVLEFALKSDQTFEKL